MSAELSLISFSNLVLAEVNTNVTVMERSGKIKPLIVVIIFFFF